MVNLMQRYFVEKKENNFFIPKEGDLHHIYHVMRMKDGDEVEIVYDQKLFLGEICQNKIKEKEEFSKTLDQRKICLIIPVLKEQKMDYILQKATELGVTHIYPFKAERSMVKPDGKEEKKLERWRKIVKEASEQSKRISIPEIPKIFDLKELIDIEGEKIVCSTLEKEKNIKKYLTKHKNYDRINIVVGPEGGLSLREETYLVNHGFVSVSLGSLIMRVETVPIYILSILSYENME